MIYVDPPYGIKYASNFQPRIDRRDVKDKDEDLTHEPEQIKAYRDTWTLGIHSYLTYLRDRLLLARELLTESGSIFVQINDDNIHLVKNLLDELFGRQNFVNVISFRKRAAYLEREGLFELFDYLLWFAKDRTQLKFRRLYVLQSKEEIFKGEFRFVDDEKLAARPISGSDLPNEDFKLERLFRTHLAVRRNYNPKNVFSLNIFGRMVMPSQGFEWKADELGMKRLLAAERLIGSSPSRMYKIFFADYPYSTLTNVWNDTIAEQSPLYAVQTDELPVERCMLTTSDPGDLVFDPTCGSGTTAWCAEKWGRRWITCDTSRVALAIARKRLMTAKFDYYELQDPERGPAGGFIYETVPHITLESIAKNTEIDAIAAKYQPEIDQALADLNRAMGKDWKEWEVPREVPHPVWPEEAKQAYRHLLELKRSGKLGVKKEAEPLLETVYRLTGHRWKDLGQVPDPMPPEDWPDAAKTLCAASGS